MKVDGSLGSLLQGVSQQSPRDRLDGQCTLQVNMTSDVVDGLQRRPPTDLVGHLGSADTVLGWHNFQTRDGNKFLAMFKNGSASVFDLNANEQSVTVEANAAAYLNGTNNIRCYTRQSDETVVVNPSVTTTMLDSKPVYINTEGHEGAIFQVLGGLYSKHYQIYIDGVLRAEYRPPDGATAGDFQWINTSVIAGRLISGLKFNTGYTAPDPGSQHFGSGYCAGWDIEVLGDIFWIRNPNPGGTILTTVSDGAGGVNFKVCTTTATDVAELPRLAPHYYAIRIAENSDPEKDLWFKFIVADLEGTEGPVAGSFGRAGYWKEAVAPGVDTTFDDATMPHRLDYNSPGFTFKRETYVPRNVGTLVSNPNPSFVDNRINDVASFQGRTVFLSGANVIMSRSRRLTNYWQGSASALADSDPVDINSTFESSQMLAAVLHNKDLTVFSPKAQFVVFGRSAVTPQTAGLVLTTQYESELQAHPTGSGRNIFFASNFGRFTGIREFFAESASEINDSRPNTQHVDQYLIGKARRLTASANSEMLLVHTDAEQTDLYLYQYLWKDNEKVQSAWSTWVFGRDIVHSFFDQDLLYLVQKVGTEYYLLRMHLDVAESDGVDYAVYLDQRFDVLDCYQSFVLPYDYLSDEELVCVQGLNCPTPGLAVTIDGIEDVAGVGRVVTLKNNMLGGDLIVGSRFLSRYMPTMPQVKDANGVSLGTAKVRARSMLVSLFDTGYIAGRVRSKYGDGPEVAFNARIVGDVDNVVGEQALSDGQFTMPFRQNVNHAEVEFYSDSHLPMGMSAVEYVGQYSKRGRRIANSGGR